MIKTVTVKLSRGTYTCPNTGTEQDSALLLSRDDQPGVVYPFPDSRQCAELVGDALLRNGLAVFTGLSGTGVFEESPGLSGTGVFEESPEFPPFFFEVYVTAPGSKEVHWYEHG